MSIQVETLFNRLPEIVAGLAASTELGTDEGLKIVEQAVKDGAPVETGALQASVYRITSTTNEYASAVSDMSSLNPKANEAGEPPVGPGEGVVGVAADYGVWVNDGHFTASGSYVPANPFFTQALEATQDQIVESVKAALNEMLLRNRVF